MTNVSRIVALGGSIYRILHVSEAPGAPDSNVAKRSYDSGWVRLKKPKTGSSDLRIFGSSTFGSSDLRMIFGSSDLRIFDCWRFGVRYSTLDRDGSADY